MAGWQASRFAAFLESNPDLVKEEKKPTVEEIKEEEAVSKDIPIDICASPCVSVFESKRKSGGGVGRYSPVVVCENVGPRLHLSGKGGMGGWKSPVSCCARVCVCVCVCVCV